MKIDLRRFTRIACAWLAANSWFYAHGIKNASAPKNEQSVIESRRDEFIRKIPMPVRVPGEFGKLSAVLLSSEYLVHTHPRLFATLVGYISERAPVVAVVSGSDGLLSGREALEEAGIPRERVNFLVHPLDTMWIRDFGPIFMRRSDGSGLVIDTNYRSRDEQSSTRDNDDRFPWVIANLLNLSSAYVPIALEGGNFLTNGQGIGVSSKGLIQRNRFRNLGENELIRLMGTYFSLSYLQIVTPLPDEPTTHADMFMTFLGPRKVVVAQALPEDSTGEAGRILDINAGVMAQRSLDGISFEVSRVPLPPKLGDYWRSYTNVFMVNGLMLVPSYSDVDPAIEEEVVRVYKSLLPDWEIRMVLADELVEIGGFLHCLTLGVPHFIDPSKLLEIND